MVRKPYMKPDEAIEQTALGEPLPDTPPVVDESFDPLTNAHERRPMSVQPVTGRVIRNTGPRPRSSEVPLAGSPGAPIRHRPMTADTGTRLRSDSANTLVEEGDITTEGMEGMKEKKSPRHQLRRYKTKRVPLVQGNLVLDCPIPDKLLDAIPRRNGEEFTHMRYTAATCDPDEFQTSGYTLRPRIYGRETELFIVVTMYNEDEVLFARTMHGVMKNIAHLCTLRGSDVWGPDSWQKVVVCIVADGRKQCDKRVLSILATLGVYQGGIAKNVVNDKPVKAHIYEFTSQLSVDPNLTFKGADKGIVPVQIMLCMKEHNAKKINSHRWFFNAFGPILNPNVCVLLDVGTRPGNVSIYQLWKVFHKNPHVGGACGEIRAMLGSAGVNLLNPLVAAQNFEYKMSNILDKPLESVFGYISVLPGAFSAYRYRALQNDVNGRGPLERYFNGEESNAQKNAGIFNANMYLAEDRILCFELIAKRQEKWLLHYCRSAFGETDVPDKLPEFISQRRRWLNGSFFAAVYALWNFFSIWRSGHSWTRTFLLSIECIYSFVNLLFSWFALANFYIIFYFVTKSLADPSLDPFGNGWGNRFFEGLRYVYIFLLIIVFTCSMGNRPQGSKYMFAFALYTFAILMAYTIFAASWLTYKGISTNINDTQWTNSTYANLAIFWANSQFRNIIISMLATYAIYAISSFLHCDPWHLFTSFLQYMMLLPSFTNLLTVYAFCNTHDVSWGTKGENRLERDLGIAKTTTKHGVEAVEVELPAEQIDINLQYEEAVHALSYKRDKDDKMIDAKTKQEDWYRSFRSQLVLGWIACNALLVAIVTSTDFTNLFSPSVGNSYMSFILWATAGLAAFRMLGSMMYLILRLFAA